RARKDVLGVISLDLFAVLLGGATALLPIFAKDILHTGPWGLGLLRAAPAVGALLMSVWLARHSLQQHVGAIMLPRWLASVWPPWSLPCRPRCGCRCWRCLRWARSTWSAW
ncbi:MAG TPA: hypothetical protein VNE18_13240, partial [Rhodanobacter sp.]|nr:hypothetical protein [Rhodanobacter sp.]